MKKIFFIADFLSRNKVLQLEKKRDKNIKSSARDNQDVSQDILKRIRTLKMTLFTEAFFAFVRGVILDKDEMKFCRFEKREWNNVSGDRSFQLGGGTSENV